MFEEMIGDSDGIQTAAMIVQNCAERCSYRKGHKV